MRYRPGIPALIIAVAILFGPGALSSTALGQGQAPEPQQEQPVGTEAADPVAGADPAAAAETDTDTGPFGALPGQGEEEIPEADRSKASRYRVHPSLLPALEKFGLGGVNENPLGGFLAMLYIIGAALLCGAVLAYHPCHIGKSRGIEEVDQPKILITYTMIGALCGVLVAAEPALAFAIFGIGGLMRFRTELSAARETGRVITATILGIFCGLELWIPVIVGLVVAWLLVLVLDWRVSVRMVVRGLKGAHVKDAAIAYRKVLEEYGLAILQEKKNPKKGQVSFVFRGGHDFDRDAMEEAFESAVSEDLLGTVDWPQEA